MDQKLLPPPYGPTTTDLKSPPLLPTRFSQLAPNSTAPRSCGQKDDRSSGGVCRAIILCVLALAVCAGFVLLYLQMRDLQHQVEDLQLQIAEESVGQFDDEETQSESRKHDMNQDPDKGFDDVDADYSSHERKRTRERRSVNGGHGHNGHRARGGQAITNSVMEGQPSSHVVPELSNNQQPYEMYHKSSWFVWTDQPSNSHASFPLQNSKFLLAPHDGYYYVYSQVTIATCNNASDSVGRGHSMYVKKYCGQQPEELLTFTLTNPTYNGGSCTYDAGYVGGVYYLEQFDFVGVKPYAPLGHLQSRISLSQRNSYFGMIQISKSQQTRRRSRCSLHFRF